MQHLNTEPNVPKTELVRFESADIHAVFGAVYDYDFGRSNATVFNQYSFV